MFVGRRIGCVFKSGVGNGVHLGLTPIMAL